ncbi:hypothetical protein H4R34_004778 [Dimargaris verticillata]|uniref:CHY-type domain-containing protein n=1 Tax=Dimargaris verticillata TaxID=2761393 RepID=A0A9W8AXN5_9FUNG|nr:hypothetical protein H4R34_004778 [Dimargaris verticillata]
MSNPHRLRICHFYQRGACRNGAQCRFQHVEPKPKVARPSASDILGSELAQHPTWQVESPTNTTDHPTVSVTVPPSDPEFPFDLAALQFEITTTDHALDPARPRPPTTFPFQVRVTNTDIPPGIVSNIQSALNRYTAKHPAVSVCTALEWVDSMLEQILAKTPAPAVRFVALGASPSTDISALPQPSSPPRELLTTLAATAGVEPPLAQNPRRAAELQQLERRFQGSWRSLESTDPHATRVQWDLSVVEPEYTLPNRDFKLSLTVPLTYPTDKCRLAIDYCNPEATIDPTRRQHIAAAFLDHAVEYPHKPLIHVLSWLNRNLQLLLTAEIPLEASASASVAPPMERMSTPSDRLMFLPPDPEVVEITKALAGQSISPARQPAHGSGDEEPFSTASAGSEVSGHEPPKQGRFTTPSHKGIQLRVSLIEARDIELLICSQLSVMVQCDRCRRHNELRRIKPTWEQSHSSAMPWDHDNAQWTDCQTCHLALGVRFRPDLLALNAAAPLGWFSLGYVDCANCTPVDQLPSTYQVVCAQCQHENAPPHIPLLLTQPSPFGTLPDHSSSKKTHPLTSVGSHTATRTQCAKCHHWMHLLMPTIVWQRLTPGWPLEPPEGWDQRPKRKPAKSDIVPGQPLPLNGTCKHYKQSNRWFRFPCCGKLYPCDTCHNDQETHPSEQANRIVCGFCSREQQFQSKSIACSHCLHKYVKFLDGRAFWEGGTGMRDKSKMNRKDSHKYKGLAKTKAK